jgi:hypothetical protein
VARTFLFGAFIANGIGNVVASVDEREETLQNDAL